MNTRQILADPASEGIGDNPLFNETCKGGRIRTGFLVFWNRIIQALERG